MKIHKSPPGGFYATFLTYKFQEGIEPQSPGDYRMADLKQIYKEWISLMTSMQDDFTIGGNTLMLARNIKNLERREYQLAFAGFCRGHSCNWEEKLKSAL